MANDRMLSGRRRDGSEFPIEVSLGSMRSGDHLLGVCFVSDITPRREFEKKLAD